jgi:spermidine synthase
MKHFSALVWVYSATLLLSAALLFFVQPMFSKMILPLLGGTPNVWTTAMLFFQLALLAGYAYAHGTSRYLSVKAQGSIHFILLLVFALALPLGIPEDWAPPAAGSPTWWQLSLMFATVGGPFFILSASAPMLQRWFAQSQHKDADNPYFLYGASNLGSIGALLVYPFVFEPLMALPEQSNMWLYGYVLLCALFALCLWLVWPNTLNTLRSLNEREATSISWRQRLTWLVLAFIPSSLMLGVTTYVTTDIGSMPMLWVIPLALYVGTFIIVFARRPILSSKTAGSLSGFLTLIFLAVMISNITIPTLWLIGFCFALFFCAALCCHLELAHAKPEAAHLTEFYLIMSLGGALGGVFNAIIVTNMFTVPIEFALILGATMFCRYAADPSQTAASYIQSIQKTWQARKWDSLAHPNIFIFVVILVVAGLCFQASNSTTLSAAALIVTVLLGFFIKNRWNFGLACLMLLALYPPGFEWPSNTTQDLLYRDRNFFGIIKVYDTTKGIRVLQHGTTNHGEQVLAEDKKLLPISYYSESSPISDAYRLLDARKSGPQKIAVAGLGAGVTACYSRPERHFDFYEIDPAMQRVAEDPNLFTFLSDCGSPYNIILGDARLTLQNAPSGYYDLIHLDAFSSDNIPMHLLTKEATEMYFEKLKEDGVILFHISNRYLDLEPVLADLAKNIGVLSIARLSNTEPIKNTNFESYPSHTLLMTRNESVIQALKSEGWSEARMREGVSLWTDQFSNIIDVIGNEIGDARFKEIHEAQKIKKNVTKSKTIYIDATQPLSPDAAPD